jgi:hypothetical protein
VRKALAGVAFLAVTGAAWPQSQAPAPAPEKPAAQPPERRSLNLRLDDPSRYSRQEAPAEKDLPALGDGTKLPARAVERSSPFPKDTNPSR